MKEDNTPLQAPRPGQHQEKGAEQKRERSKTLSSGSWSAIAIRNTGSCGCVQKSRAKKTRYESRFGKLVGEERGGS